MTEIESEQSLTFISFILYFLAFLCLFFQGTLWSILYSFSTVTFEKIIYNYSLSKWFMEIVGLRNPSIFILYIPIWIFIGVSLLQASKEIFFLKRWKYWKQIWTSFSFVYLLMLIAFTCIKFSASSSLIHLELILKRIRSQLRDKISRASARNSVFHCSKVTSIASIISANFNMNCLISEKNFMNIVTFVCFNGLIKWFSRE